MFHSHTATRLPVTALLAFLMCAPSGLGAWQPSPDEPAAPPEDPFPQAVAVPDGILDGGSEWFNTRDPLSLRDLRGKIVLLDFWTYCCINCLHVLPDLKYLEEKYADQLVVIGVHSAKFDNEKVAANIREAIMRYGIRHPVVNDDQMIIWQRFGTRAWPTLTLIDPEGRYLGSQSGEGNRELFDALVGRLVEHHRRKGTLDETPLRFELEEYNRPASALRYPGKIHADPATDRLFITDTGHNRIVVCNASGDLQQVIGSGRAGHRDGGFSVAEFGHPQGLALSGDRLYVADTENHLIRVVDLAAETVSTLAGTGEQGRPGPGRFGRLQTTALNSPWDVAVVGSTLFIAMAGPHQIWSHELGTDSIGVFAGSAREDVINGRLADAAFAQPSAIVADRDGTVLYVADSEGSAIRRLATDPGGRVETIAGTSELPRGQSLFAFGDVDGVGADARFQHPLGLALDGSVLFVADSYNHRIRQIDLETHAVTSWLGNGSPGDGTEPLEFNEPGGLAVSASTLWVADTNNHRVLAVDRASKTARIIAISGLQPPQPPRSTAIPDDLQAVRLPAATVRSSGPIRVSVELTVPTGYKWNELAPVTWEILAGDDQSVVAPDQLGVRDEATVEDGRAQFDIPLTGAPGNAEIAIRMSWGYCSETSPICRLAEAAWQLELIASEDADQSELQLPAPVDD